ncbi:hypothetical protein NUSPORA_02629 [Nucleospora cyclopteri]
MILLKRGAEAEIYKENNIIIKKRIPKKYRIKELDHSINKNRTRKEAGIIEKMNSLEIPCPKLVKREKYDIYMEYIEGRTVKETLEEISLNNDKSVTDLTADQIMVKIGEIVAMMHSNQIIHGDLTTLNFLINGDQIYAIDFGLSFNSLKIEDKAVDLYLFEKALLCAHNDQLIKYFYEGYQLNGQLSKKLEEIRKRGRKRE